MMLVLTRRTDEVINIGHDIEVTVLEVSGDNVRIGINAPRKIEVHRSEVYQEINSPDTLPEHSRHRVSAF